MTITKLTWFCVVVLSIALIAFSGESHSESLIAVVDDKDLAELTVTRWIGQDKVVALTDGQNDGDVKNLYDAMDDIDSKLAALRTNCVEVTDKSPEFRACMFRRNLQVVLKSVNALVEEELSEFNDPRIKNLESIRKALENPPTLSKSLWACDVFARSTAPIQGVFSIFSERNSSVDCNSSKYGKISVIDVPANSTDPLDKVIVGQANRLANSAFQNNKVFLRQTADVIRRADAKWKAFQDNVLSDQYPWELLLLNDWAGPRVFSSLKGNLVQPPVWQLRGLHPVPTAVLDVHGGDSLFRPRVSVELIGARFLDEKNNYQLNWAVSAVVTLRGSNDDGTGWGVLFTKHKWSIGVTTEQRVQGNVVNLVFGLDFAEMVDTQQSNLMKEWQAIRDKL